MISDLGEREKQVLLLSYLPRRRVAEIMGVADSTINSHRSKLFLKLGVDTLTEAVLIALKEGIVTLDEFTMEVY